MKGGLISHLGGNITCGVLITTLLRLQSLWSPRLLRALWDGLQTVIPYERDRGVVEDGGVFRAVVLAFDFVHEIAVPEHVVPWAHFGD